MNKDLKYTFRLLFQSERMTGNSKNDELCKAVDRVDYRFCFRSTIYPCRDGE